MSNTELSLLDNATAVYDMLAVVTDLGALLANVAGSDATGERERGRSFSVIGHAVLTRSIPLPAL